MRYALAGLAIAVAALVWWGMRERPAPRAEPARPAAEEPVFIAECFFGEPEPDRLLFVGRVVGAAPGYQPQVAIDIEGQGRSETRAGPDGRYQVRAGRRPLRGWTPVHVEASVGDLGAVASLSLLPTGPDRIPVPTLVLAPLHALKVTVTHGGAPVPRAQVAIAEAAVATADAEGRLALRLPPGEYVLRAASTGYGRGEAKARVPDVAAVSIELPRERTVAVTVVEKGTGRPVVDAMLELHEQRKGDHLQRFSPPVSASPTDDFGMTEIHGLSADTMVRVAARAPGYPPPQTFHDVGKITIPAQVTAFRIELDPPRTIRWPVVAGDVAAPPDGTPIAIRPWSSSYLREVPAAGVMERGHLVVEGFGPGPAHGIAEEPGGGLALIRAQDGQDIGPEISFRRPRRVDVFAHEPSGAPVEGAAFLLRDPGGNAMARLGITDREGKVAFPGHAGGRAEVYHLPNPAEEWSNVRVGGVDLDAGDGYVEVVLRPEVELVVRVRTEGKPGLPAGYVLYVDSVPVEAEADFERGILRARVRPADNVIKVALGAPGYAPVRAETRTGEVEIDLLSGATLTLDVIRPPEGDTSIELEVWREDWKVWTGMILTGGPRGETAYAKLAPGRYRAVDRRSGVTSEEVRLENGSSARLVLDLSRTGLVRGRVEMPEGTEPADVCVEVSGIELRGVESGRVGVAKDGAFRFTVPGDRPVALRASHPTLRAANEVTLTRPRDDVVLRLEPGPTATFELDHAPQAKPEARILVYLGEPDGEPVARLRAAVAGRRLTFGGFATGTCNLWIDARPFAPITLRGVALSDGPNDLGQVPTGAGSSIRVKILVPEGQAAPRIGLHAWRTAEPGYSRVIDSRGEGEVILSGLGPGTFHLSATPVSIAGTTRRLEQEVTLDGTETREVVLDLR